MSATLSTASQTWSCVLSGVSGCGKSSVGEAMAKQWNQRQQNQQTIGTMEITAADTIAVFFDGDDYHPVANKSKMQSGVPLNDADRAGWLRTIAQLVNGAADQTTISQESSPQLHLQQQNRIIACSALKQKYREIIFGRRNDMEEDTITPIAAAAAPSSSSSSSSAPPLLFLVYLSGSYFVLEERLRARQGHFMKSGMLTSQLDTLVPPTMEECRSMGVHLIIIDIDQPLSCEQQAKTIIEFIVETIRKQQQQQR